MHRCLSHMRGAAGLVLPIVGVSIAMTVLAAADCSAVSTERYAGRFEKQKIARSEPPPPADTRGFEDRAIVLDGVGAPGLRDRRVVIVRPGDYDPQKRYPALFVNDGEAVGQQAFDIVGAVDRLVERGAIEPHVVVAIESTRSRAAEYTFAGPSYDALRTQWRHEGARPEARSSDQRYVDFLADVVAPLAEEHASIDRARERTTILGFSYGGLSALHAAMRRPERFGRVICESASLWWAHGRTVSAFHQYAGPLPVRMWIDAGTMEGNPGDAIPYMVRDARALARVAVERGLTLGHQLGYYEAPLGEHSDFWIAARIEHVLAFSLSNVEVDLERDASELRLWILAPVLEHDSTTSFSLEMYLPAGLRMTAFPWEARVTVGEPAVVRTSIDGLVHARSLVSGTSTLVARYGRLRDEESIRVKE